MSSLFGLSHQLYSINLEDIVRKNVAEEYGIKESSLCPKVEYKRLPVIRLFGRFVAKIAGMYDRFRNKIFIDILDYLYSDVYNRIKILAEEFAHAAQEVVGRPRRIYRNFLDYLTNYYGDEKEREAKIVAENVASKILGGQSSI